MVETSELPALFQTPAIEQPGTRGGGGGGGGGPGVGPGGPGRSAQVTEPASKSCPMVNAQRCVAPDVIAMVIPPMPAR